MENQPNPSPPEPESDSPSTGAASKIANSVTSTISEWFNSLLRQPTEPPFGFNADFNNELSRAVRLIVAVLIISGILVGAVNVIAGDVNVQKTGQDTIFIIIGAFLVALISLPVLYLCGVRIVSENGEAGEKKALNIAQVFYSILFIFVPWIPILVCIQALLTVETILDSIFLIDILLLAPFLCIGYMLYNLAKSIRKITKCSKTRIWVSLVIPLLVIAVYFVI